MEQTRRKFVKNGLLFSAAIGSSFIFANSINYKLKSEQEFSVDELTGKASPFLIGNHYKLRKETSEALETLIKDAKKVGFKPQVLSSYRNYSHQKRIWDNKFESFTKQEKLSPQKAIQKIIAYSTIPGTSRHHWGTDFDMVDAAKGIPTNPLNEKHFNPGGIYYDFKIWLNENAEKYGFFEVYTNEKGRKGFKYEPWHFSYLPIACEMMRQYMNKNLIFEIRKSDIKGASYLNDEFISNYYKNNFLDINPDLIP
ncbi:MAG: M15 family metallopeptidase [Flavobacteriaceae bacterium]|nr:M15 family metallopeptidase [Flavobacteriaceae bacterium]